MATQSSAMIFALPLVMACSYVHSASIFLSTAANGASLGGQGFSDGDIVEFDAGSATILFDEAGKFVGSEDIDAVHVRNNGNILFSTRSPGQLNDTNATAFMDGDIVEYNPATNTASILFLESTFDDGSANITAFHVLDNGNLVISANSTETLDGFTFDNGDLVEYDPAAAVGMKASPFFSESLFSADANIDAVHVLANGHIVLSTVEDGLTLGGQVFGNGDLVEYDPVAETASLFFLETSFGSMNEDIDAVHIGAAVVPLPAAVWLFGGGLLGLAGVARRPTR